MVKIPYNEDKESKTDSSDSIKPHITSHGTSTPKSERERKQKEFTSSQVSDMSSELTKANRKLRSGVFNQAQYKAERERIFKKYDITRDERIRFLGKKFAN